MLADTYLHFSGRRDELVPPRRWKLAGWRSDSRETGEQWTRVLVELAGLRPGDRVLDIGCGPGRMAAPLTRYLDGGSYEGFDVDPDSIEWGQREITPHHPNFRFLLARIRNAQYSPFAPQTASTYTFPYEDSDFDLATALSVFTHMHPEEIARYLGETSRVLRPGGQLVATFFLLTEEVERSLAGRERELRLEAELVDSAGRRYRGRDFDVPEHRIAIREADVLEMLAAAGLEVDATRYGRWHAPERRRQDLVVARKVAEDPLAEGADRRIAR